jgi:subtilisin family serine protease
MQGLNVQANDHKGPVRARIWSYFRGIALITVLFGTSTSANAETRLIIRTQSLSLLQTVCRPLGCTVQYGLGDPLGQVFLVTTPLDLGLNVFLGIPGVLDVEVDQVGRTMNAVSQGTAPSALYDSTPVNYYGMTVHRGYIVQPATQILSLTTTQSTYHVEGSGIVAVIDTGVDTAHPALRNVLLPAYDFTRNKDGGDEKADVTQSTTAVVDETGTTVVNQSTTAVIDQTRGMNLDRTEFAAFGHGTMVAGIVHLVAPKAFILPLKAFNVDGTGYTSDVIRAIYYAARNNANVLNMSFSFSSPSSELNSALTHVNKSGVIAVAAAGNNGSQTLVYPAAYQSLVMGVASTANDDTLSGFSNYGPNLVWVGAPGEGVVTLYPYSTYAATWGTSFSTPFVAGTAALLLDLKGGWGESQAAAAIAHARFISTAVGNGRLDINQALEAWQ